MEKLEFMNYDRSFEIIHPEEKKKRIKKCEAYMNYVILLKETIYALQESQRRREI